MGNQMGVRMSPDDLYDEMADWLHLHLPEFSKRQEFLFGFCGEMRQLPAYISFCQRFPDFGNAELAGKIAAAFRVFLLRGEVCHELSQWTEVFAEEYVTYFAEDFGSEISAKEGGIGLLILYDFGFKNDCDGVFELLRGITECCLCSGDMSEIIQSLLREQSIRQHQFELIKSSRDINDELLENCLAIT
jgi:hypothetical protein